MEQLVNWLDVAMFNAILLESDEELPTDPISDPISDSKVLRWKIRLMGWCTTKECCEWWHLFILSRLSLFRKHKIDHNFLRKEFLNSPRFIVLQFFIFSFLFYIISKIELLLMLDIVDGLVKCEKWIEED